jgi:hypothetical protein
MMAHRIPLLELVLDGRVIEKGMLFPIYRRNKVRMSKLAAG